MITGDQDSFLSMNTLNVVKEEDVKQNEEIIVPPVPATATNSGELLEVIKTDDKPVYANQQFEGKEENAEAAPSSESQDSSSNLSVFADYLIEEGVLSAEVIGENKIGSIEDLKDFMKKQIEVERRSDLTESQLRYMDSIESGLPLNEYEAMEKEINGLESISLDDLNKDGQLRFDIMVMDLIGSGLTEEKAVVMAQRSFDSGKDQDDAKDAIQTLYERRVKEYNDKLESKKESTKADYESVKSLVESKESLMGEIKLTKEEKENIIKTMTTRVGYDEGGIPINEFSKWRIDNGVEAEIILNALFVSTNG